MLQISQKEYERLQQAKEDLRKLLDTIWYFEGLRRNVATMERPELTRTHAVDDWTAVTKVAARLDAQYREGEDDSDA